MIWEDRLNVFHHISSKKVWKKESEGKKRGSGISKQVVGICGHG